MNRLSIAAIDLGYGGTKIAFPNQDGNLQFNNTPSIAVQANDIVLSKNGPEKLDLHKVDVNGAHYLVGPDVNQLQDPYSSRIANFDFTSRYEYMALYKGALINIGADHIDRLIVGLPVNMMKKHAATLKQKLQGTHCISENKNVTASQVEVMAQPIGGMVDYAFSADSYDALQDQVTLVIDPGYFTLDWIVAKGLKIFPNRSGNHPGGMHAILSALSRSLIDTYDIKQIDLFTLEQGLRKGNFRLFGKKIDMLPHWEAAKPSINDSITSLINSVGDASTIDQIVLVGGAATYLMPAISKRFSDHKISLADSPVYANVRGFYQAGIRLAMSKGK